MTFRGHCWGVICSMTAVEAIGYKESIPWNLLSLKVKKFGL
jgi:hypothetical protein